MPIKALKPRLAEAGKIKMGGLSEKGRSKSKGEGEWYPPVKYDEFHVTTLDRKRDGNQQLVDDYVLMWHLRYFNADPQTKRAVDAAETKEEKVKILKPVKIRKIPILLHSDDIDDVLRTEYNCYIGKARYKECDGEEAIVYEITKNDRGHRVQTGQRKKKPCECPKGPSGYVSKRYWDGKTPKKENLVCSPHGEFRCLINLPDAAGPGALYTLRTKGWGTIASTYGSLEEIRKRCGGYLTNVPCLLVMHRGTGKDQNGTKTSFWSAHVEMDADLIEALGRLREVHSMVAALGGPPQPRSLGASPRALAGPEEEDYADEFHPEDDEIPIDDMEDEEVHDVEFEEREDPDPEESPQPQEDPEDSGSSGGMQHAVELRGAVQRAWQLYQSQNPNANWKTYEKLCKQAGAEKAVILEKEGDVALLAKILKAIESELPDDIPFP